MAKESADVKLARIEERLIALDAKFETHHQFTAKNVASLTHRVDSHGQFILTQRNDRKWRGWIAGVFGGIFATMAGLLVEWFRK